MTRPDDLLHNNKAPKADRRKAGYGFGHALWPCLMASVMCHVFLVAITSDYGERSGRAGSASERIVARLDVPVEHAVQTPARILLPQGTAPVGLEKTADSPAPPGSAKATDEMKAALSQGGARAEAVSAYVPSELLSVKPRILDAPETIIPADLAADEHGSVIVQLLVNTEGGVDSVLLQGSELTAAGTRLFIERLNSLRLEPGQMNGTPSKALYRLEFTVQATSPERAATPR